MEAITSIRVVAGLRAAFGLALTFATPRLVNGMVRGEPSGDMVLFARAVGIRDLVLGVGCLLASSDRAGAGELRRWVAVSLASDAADVVAGATGAHRVGAVRAVVAAAVPVPFVAAGFLALRRLYEG